MPTIKVLRWGSGFWNVSNKEDFDALATHIVSDYLEDIYHDPTQLTKEFSELSVEASLGNKRAISELFYKILEDQNDDGRVINDLIHVVFNVDAKMRKSSKKWLTSRKKLTKAEREDVYIRYGLKKDQTKCPTCLK